MCACTLKLLLATFVLLLVGHNVPHNSVAAAEHIGGAQQQHLSIGQQYNWQRAIVPTTPHGRHRHQLAQHHKPHTHTNTHHQHQHQHQHQKQQQHHQHLNQHDDVAIDKANATLTHHHHQQQRTHEQQQHHNQQSRHTHHHHHHQQQQQQHQHRQHQDNLNHHSEEQHTNWSKNTVVTNAISASTKPPPPRPPSPSPSLPLPATALQHSNHHHRHRQPVDFHIVKSLQANSNDGHAYNHTKPTHSLGTPPSSSPSAAPYPALAPSTTTAATLDVSKSKSMSPLSDAIWLRNFKATQQLNNRLHIADAMHWKSATAVDEANSEVNNEYDYYDELDDEEDENVHGTEDELHDNHKEAAAVANYDHDFGSLQTEDSIDFDDVEFTGVVNGIGDNNKHSGVVRQRRHHYGHGHNARTAIELDYADDEPYDPAKQEGRVPGEVTQKKINELGTEEGVKQSHFNYRRQQQRQQQTTEKTPQQKVTDHIKLIREKAQCQQPQLRVLPISDEASKIFTPSCTVLHRCGPDTGCCAAWEVCTNKSYENVQLYVNAYIITGSGNSITRTEVKTLANHTECHCVNRSYMSRYKRSGANSPIQLPTAAMNRNADFLAVEEDEDYWDWNEECHCPTHFDAITTESDPYELWRRTSTSSSSNDNSCRCDCRNNNSPCQRLKRGEEGFAVADRKCIRKRRCKAPTCAFGEYKIQTGRCPRAQTHTHTATHHNYGIG